MPFTDDLLVGVAGLISAAGVAAFRDDGVYADSEVGIVMQVVPQSPPGVVTLTGYSLGDDPAYADSTQMVQVRCRAAAVGDPRPTQALDDAVFGVLAGLHDLTLTTGVQVQSIQRTSCVPLGQDDNKRFEAVSNYRLALYRPTAHRL